VREQWEQIAGEQDSQGTDRSRLIRRYLRYDGARHRVYLALSESVWSGDVEVRFQWGTLEIPFRTRFLSVDKTTECSPMEISILSSSWGDSACLIVGEECYLLHLPKVQGNRGLVFRTDDGRATRQWQPGEEYYVLLPTNQSQAPSNLRRFEIYLRIEGENGITQTEGLARSDLARGTLVGGAWPLAQLTLDISCGTWACTLPIQTDDNGWWRTRWRDLGIGGIPDGSVNLTLSWRGLIKAHLTFADVPFVAESDIKLQWVDQQQREFLEVTATVSNKGSNCQARIVVLGDYPWAGQIWDQIVNLDDRGFLQAQIRVEREQARWLVILPAEPTASKDKQQPWAVEPIS